MSCTNWLSQNLVQANIVSVESPLYFKDYIEKGDCICMYCEFNAAEAAPEKPIPVASNALVFTLCQPVS